MNLGCALVYFGLIVLLTGCETTPHDAVFLGYNHQMQVYQYEVTDGDSMTALDPHGQRIRIRLTGIDAPEKKSTYGQRKSSAARLMFSGSTALN